MAAVEEELRQKLVSTYLRWGVPAVIVTSALVALLALWHPLTGVMAAVIVLLADVPFFYWLAVSPLRTLAPLSQTLERLTGTLVTDEKQPEAPFSPLQSPVRRATARLQQVEQVVLERSEFIALASHELRTPVTSLGVLLESLLQGAKDDPQLRDAFLQDLQREVQRLHTLVNDLLDVAKYEAGPAGLDKEPVDIPAVVADTVASLRPLAQKRAVTVRQELSPSLPVIQGDPLALTRLLANLLANAIKFTPPGGKVILEASSREGMLELRVRDTGIGIPAEAIPHIFKRFYRVDTARDRSQGGSGLGLAIAEQITRAHGGTIRVDSVVSQGTTVTCLLPLGESPRGAPDRTPDIPAG